MIGRLPRALPEETREAIAKELEGKGFLRIHNTYSRQLVFVYNDPDEVAIGTDKGRVLTIIDREGGIEAWFLEPSIFSGRKQHLQTTREVAALAHTFDVLTARLPYDETAGLVAATIDAMLPPKAETERMDGPREGSGILLQYHRTRSYKPDRDQ